MKKRGQVTVFMIVGLVLLIIFVLIFALKDFLYETIKGSEGTKIILNNKIQEIDSRIKDCVDNEANTALILLGKQGGSFNPVNYRNFYADKISYLCFAIPDSKKCVNNGLTLIELEKELDNYLTTRIRNCINIESFRDDSRYSMTIGNFNFKTKIMDKTVLFNITYPITLERKEIKVDVSDFSESINNPLGKIQQAVLDILNIESEGLYFDNVMYVLAKRNEFTVIKKRPSPDKIYVVSHKDFDYKFQFAVKGEE